MAKPIILIDSTDGTADDAICSGAGPTTVVTGTSGRTYGFRAGFFEASAPDLSGVATDGSHALLIVETTAGRRNFDSITAVKDTDENLTCDTLNGNATVTNTTTTGWTVGDIIMITNGSSAGDLYTTISTIVDGTSFTATNTPTNSTSGTAIRNPKQVTVFTGFTADLANDRIWGIGGVRQTLAGTVSKKLFDNNGSSGDAMPGWRARMKSGHTETISATYVMRRAGDATNGLIIIEGEEGAATMPVLTFSNNGIAIASNANYSQYKFIDVRNSNATKTASVGLQFTSGYTSQSVIGCRFNHQTNYFWRGVALAGDSRVEDCDIGYCADIACYDISAVAYPRTYINNRIHHCSYGIYSSSTRDSISCEGNDIYDNTNDGLIIGGTGATLVSQLLLIRNNTFHSNGGSGINFNCSSAQQNGWALALVENNNFTANGAYGINFSGASMSDQLLYQFAGRIRNNNFGTGGTANTSGDCNLTLTLTGADNIAVDPGYTDATNGDFRPGTNVKALAYPTAVKAGTGPARSYIDIGSYQREESGTGGQKSYTF